jgi:hypothetical protein
VLGDPSREYGGTSMLLPYPLWDACGTDDSLIVYDPIRNTVRRFAATGDEREPLSLPAKRNVPMTFDRVFGMIYRWASSQAPSGVLPDSATMRTQFESQWPMMQRMFAHVLPEYVDLDCAGDGSVWIQPFDHVDGLFGAGAEWVRLGPDGSRTIYVMPDRFTPLRFAGDRIWGSLRNELDIQSVAWLRLPGSIQMPE